MKIETKFNINDKAAFLTNWITLEKFGKENGQYYINVLRDLFYNKNEITLFYIVGKVSKIQTITNKEETTISCDLIFEEKNLVQLSINEKDLTYMNETLPNFKIKDHFINKK